MSLKKARLQGRRIFIENKSAIHIRPQRGSNLTALNYVDMPANKKFKPLTETEIVFGFGPQPTDAQLDEFFSRPDGKAIPLDKAFAQIRADIQKRRTKKK